MMRRLGAILGLEVLEDTYLSAGPGVSGIGAAMSLPRAGATSPTIFVQARRATISRSSGVRGRRVRSYVRR